MPMGGKRKIYKNTIYSIPANFFLWQWNTKRYTKVRKRLQNPLLTKNTHNRGSAQRNRSFPCCALDHSCVRIWCKNRTNSRFQTCTCTEEALTKSRQTMENLFLVNRVHWGAHEKLTLKFTHLHYIFLFPNITILISNHENFYLRI